MANNKRSRARTHVYLDVGVHDGITEKLDNFKHEWNCWDHRRHVRFQFNKQNTHNSSGTLHAMHFATRFSSSASLKLSTVRFTVHRYTSRTVSQNDYGRHHDWCIGMPFNSTFFYGRWTYFYVFLSFQYQRSRYLDPWFFTWYMYEIISFIFIGTHRANWFLSLIHQSLQMFSLCNRWADSTVWRLCSSSMLMISWYRTTINESQRLDFIEPMKLFTTVPWGFAIDKHRRIYRF